MRTTPALLMMIALLAGCTVEPPAEVVEAPAPVQGAEPVWQTATFDGEFTTTSAANPGLVHGADGFEVPDGAQRMVVNGTIAATAPGETKVLLQPEGCAQNSCAHEVVTVGNSFSYTEETPQSGPWRLQFFAVAGAQSGSYTLTVDTQMATLAA